MLWTPAQSGLVVPIGSGQVTPYLRRTRDAGGGGGNALLTSLVAYLKLDEASGNALDAHSGGLHFTDNSTVQATTGLLNGCRRFDGSAEYLSRASNPFNGLTAFSVSTWVQNTRANTNFILDTAIGSYDNAVGDGFALQFSGSSSGNKLRFRRSESYAHTDLAEDTGLAVNTWAHYVMTVSSAGAMKLYKNGTQQAATGTVNAPLNNNSATHVGAHVTGSTTPQSYWQGEIDETGFWQRELTAAEVTTLYNGGTPFPYGSFT